MYELDALALEYQRDYGSARRNLELSDFVNNPFINCKTSIFRMSLFEKLGDFRRQEFCVLSDDVTHD